MTSQSPSPSSLVVEQPLEVPVLRGAGSMSVQLLVDESGSMGGYRESLQPFERWIWRAISRTRSYGYDVAQKKSCGFNAAKGIVCSEADVSLRKTTGSTNLDVAIARADDADLTVIVTDGVAASGATPSDPCAEGVDAACVGIQLADAVKRMRAGLADGGVWVVPVSAQFDGDFYTERRISASSFDTSSVEATGIEPLVRMPRNLSSGELVYAFKGERPLLIIVVGKTANLGRAFISGLAETRAMETDIGTRHQAMEVYPGYVPRLVWSSIRRSPSYPAVAKEALLNVKDQRLTFRCGAEGQESGQWDLTSAIALSDSVATVPLISLPVKEITSETNARGVQLTPDSVGLSQFRVRISIGCEFNNTDCNAGATYKMEARRDAAKVSALDQWSTTEPERQPSRVFGLTSIVSAFYQRFGVMEPLPVAQLRLCSGAS